MEDEINQKINLTDVIPRHVEPFYYAQHCHEAILAFAYALDKTIKGEHTLSVIYLFPKASLVSKAKISTAERHVIEIIVSFGDFPDLNTSSELNENATKLANLKNGTHFSIEHFFYNNSAVVQRMKRHLEDTSFQGLSVSIYVILMYPCIIMYMKAVHA